MPRIAPALAVLLTFVTCIGFNIARYPVVWEMAAPPEGFSQSQQSGQSATVPQSPLAASSLPIPKVALALKSATGAEPPAAEQSATDRSPSRGWTETTSWPSGPRASFAVASPLTDESPSMQRHGQAPGGTPDRWLAEDSEDEPVPPRWPEAPVPQRPLVAVAPVQRAVDPGGRSRLPSRRDPPAVACAYGGRLTVRRLPPLDQVWNVPKANDQPERSDDAILIYPMAGMK